MTIDDLKKALMKVAEQSQAGYYSTIEWTENSCIKDIENRSKYYHHEKTYVATEGNGGVFMRTNTGGYEGGSCWGGEASRHHNEAAGLEQFSLVADFCERHLPDMPFIIFRDMEKLVEKGSMTVTEYYGNSSDYRLSFLSLDRLFSFMKEKGLEISLQDDGPSP